MCLTIDNDDVKCKNNNVKMPKSKRSLIKPSGKSRHDRNLSQPERFNPPPPIGKKWKLSLRVLERFLKEFFRVQ